MMSELLKDKVCIVTGAAQGIGKSIALKMIEDGAIVYGCDRLADSMRDMELEYERFHALYFDVTDTQASKESMMRVKRTRSYRCIGKQCRCGVQQENRYDTPF